MFRKHTKAFGAYRLRVSWMMVVSVAVLLTACVHAWLPPSWHQDVGSHMPVQVWGLAALVFLGSLLPQVFGLWWAWRASELDGKVPVTFWRLLAYSVILTLWAIIVGHSTRGLIESTTQAMDWLIVSVRSLPTLLGLVAMVSLAPAVAAMFVLDAPLFAARKKQTD